MSDPESAQQLALLRRRTGFGAPPAGAPGSYADAVTALLSPTPADPGAMRTPPPAPGVLAQPGRNDATARRAFVMELRRQNAELLLWWLDRMVAADRPFLEKVTFFWHGHFATSTQKVRSPALMLQQNATLRALGLGSFRTLARAMVRDPAMLLWLDGPKNRRASPNENLGREFMELFTLGHGNYTDEDVKQAARSLTGWRVDRRAGTATYVSQAHDDGSKTVLGTVANFNDSALVDLLISRPASARFLAGRVWARFASEQPPSPATLARLVSAYGPEWDLTALFRAMLTTEEFLRTSGQLVKQPVELVVGTLRAVGVRPSALAAKDAKTLVGVLQGMGQVPFRPPSVGGWPSGRAWLGTSAAASRIRLGEFVASRTDLGPLASGSAGSRVAAVGHLLSVPAWTPRTRTALAAAASNPQRLLTLAIAAPEYAIS